jgi:bisphosphoglycerate-dependent phosphoglycerate mutase
MKIKSAIEALNDDYYASNQLSITADDIKRLNRRRYDELNEMTKEELIHMIMGDELYYNR